MLKLFRYQPFCKDTQSLIQVSSFNFSKYSSRDIVPRILKHPKFTSQGIKKRKHKSYQYDLTQPHIKNPELYYNEVIEKKEERRNYLQNKYRRTGIYPIDLNKQRPILDILSDLSDPTFNQRGSNRLMLNIAELHKYYPEEINEDVKEMIAGALRSIGRTQLHLRNIKELSMLGIFMRRYGVNDAEIWRAYAANTTKHFKREDHDPEYNLFSNPKDESNFVNMITFVIQSARTNNIELKYILEEIGLKCSQRLDFLSNTKNFVKLVNALGNVPEKKGDSAFWSIIEGSVGKYMNKFDTQDRVNVLYAFSKANYDCETATKIVGALSDEVAKFTDPIQKIAIISQSMANLKKNNPKFTKASQAVLEQNLHKLTKPQDVRFTLCSFPRIGGKSPKVINHCIQQVINEVNTLNLSQTTHYLALTHKRNYPVDYFNALLERLQQNVAGKALYQLSFEQAKQYIPYFEALQGRDGVEVKEIHERFADYVEFKAPKFWEIEDEPEVRPNIQ